MGKITRRILTLGAVTSIAGIGLTSCASHRDERAEVEVSSSVIAKLDARHRAEYASWLERLSPAARAEEADLLESAGISTELSSTRSRSGVLRSLTGHRMHLEVEGAMPSDDAATVARKFLAEIAS